MKNRKRRNKGASGSRSERRKVEQKAHMMSPIDRVAERVRAVATGERVSTIVYSSDGKGQYAGGMVGDPVHIADALFHAAKENKATFVVLTEVVKTLQAHGVTHEDQEAPKMEIVKDEEERTGESEVSETNCAYLLAVGKMTKRQFNALDNIGVFDLTAIGIHTRREIKNVRNMGDKSFQGLCDLLREYQIDFKGEDRYKRSGDLEPADGAFAE